MNKTTGIIIAVALVILAAVGGFFGGMHYQKSKTGNGRFGMYAAGQMMGAGFRQGMKNGNMRMQQNAGVVRGQILSIANNNMTIKLPDGSSKIVVLSNSTNFVQSSKASASDAKQGDTVMVLGTTNSDGSVTAQNVQLNPQQMMRPTPSTTSAQ